MPKVLGMRCRECGEEYPASPVHVCELCFGPLEVVLNWEEIAPKVSREKIAAGPPSMWRYHDLLPVEGPPTVGKNVGWTPLVKAEKLGRELGLSNLYIKNDAVNHPTLSFKDRVVACALTKAREFGYDTVACASTGNLANSVAAHAAAGGSLISKIYKGLNELDKLGLIDGGVPTKMYAAQAKGCSPITTAIKTNAEVFRPQKPNTIAKSIAIGNPADGYLAMDTVRRSGGWADDVTDAEILDGIRLLGRTEGIFTETAGGVTVSAAKKLAEPGRSGK